MRVGECVGIDVSHLNAKRESGGDGVHTNKAHENWMDAWTHGWVGGLGNDFRA
jgi:hypothetical protein